jgi:hypothetical protein
MCNDAAGNAFGCPKSCRGSPESGLSLSGKVTVVIGASKGIGASVAEVRKCLKNEKMFSIFSLKLKRHMANSTSLLTKRVKFLDLGGLPCK